MKKIFTLLIFCCLFFSCTDDNNEATFDTPSTTALASKPEANPAFDDSYMGIYKGIVIGNISGALYVDILNDDKIWAKLQTDNHETYILEKTPLSGSSGRNSSPEWKRYRFQNENISFEMELDEYGNNITVSNFEYFSDNTAKVCLIKEKSTSLIKCYTGMFTSHDEIGSVNFTSDGELRVKGLSKNLNSNDITHVNGAIDVASPSDGALGSDNEIDPNIQYKLNANLHIGEISGYLSKYSFDGNWIYENNELGNWNATRIL